MLCFIVGNDFLPHLPGYSVKLAGIDVLIEFYRKNLNKFKSYLTSKSDINIKALERFFRILSLSEENFINKVND